LALVAPQIIRMNTDLSYQINYGTVSAGTTPARPDPNAPLFASEDGVVASLSNSECIFQMRRTGESHVMTYQVLQALDQCREFRPLDEHVTRIQTTIAGLQTQRENVQRVLQSLIERGLLVSDQSFLDRLAAAPSTASMPAPRAVFIRACNRPHEVERLLRSLSDYERRFRASRRYVLLDDSTELAAANRHRDLLREFARATGCELTYLGAPEQTRLVQRLAKAVGGSAKALPSLLLRPDGSEEFGGGRAWNLALLLAAGSRLILLDDDNCLPLRRPDGQREGINPDPSGAAFTQFYRNAENAFGAGEEIADDPFELHLDVLGKPFGALTHDARYAIQHSALRGLSLGRLDHLRADATVIATLQGAYGSSRSESSAWMYQLAGESRAELWSSREDYLRNIEGGSLWYGHRQARVATAGTFTPFTLDARELLPCTNPTGRGEDALFAQVARLCHPDSLVVELPVAIGHLQEGSRRRSELTRQAPPPRFNYFVADFVQRQLNEFLAEDPRQRLGLLAENLRDIAGASASRRLRLLREYLAYVRADTIERLQHQFESASEAPIYWQADVRSIIEANGRALTSRQPPRLGGWPDDLDEQGCAAMLREDVTRLADAYAIWPTVWQHAREQGERLLGAL
jgi:hypothetical protein